MSSLSSILSPRNMTLFVFILVVLFLGATFDVQVGPESFVEGAKSKCTGGKRLSMYNTCV